MSQRPTSLKNRGTDNPSGWLKSHNAAVRVLITGRRLWRVIVKYDPDQPRAPAGGPTGGQWVRVGENGNGGDGIGGGFPLPGLGLVQGLFTDESGDAPWDFFLNTYTEDDDLAAQVVINDDETATTTEWDTGNVERWAVRQTATDTDRALVTSTELARDGTGQITFGPGANGKLVLAVSDGELNLMPVDQAPDETVAYAPTEGDVLKPLTDSAARIIPRGAGGAAAGAGALVAGITSFSTPAGGESFTQLSDDVRLALRDDGQLPAVQERVDPSWTDRFTGGTWRTLPDVPVAEGPAGTVTIDGDALRSAIGDERFDALGQLDGRGVSLSMQAAPVAPRDIPDGSIFQGGSQSTGLVHSPQGTVVDWAAPYAAAGPGKATVLELSEPGIRGLAWTSGDDKPMIGPLHIQDVDRACPRFSDVHQVAVEADMRVRAANPELSARELGTLIHREIWEQMRGWPEMGIGMWSEQGVFMGVDQGRAAVLPRGAVRFDVLEDAGRGTVCVYDPKTGAAEMSRSQMLRYWQEARLFRTGTTRVFVIPLYTRR